MALTPKQEKFCQNILAGMSQADAYRNSFNVKQNTKAATIQDSASKLMATPAITQRVEEMRKPVIAKLQLTREWVLEQLIENVSMAKALEPVISKDGQTTGEVKQNLPAANKALEMLGKEIGMFTDKLDINAHVTTHEASLDDLA